MLQFHIDKSAPDTFVVGKAVGFFDDFFLVQKVSPRGEWDGFGLYPNSDLVAVSQDAEYLGMLARLLEQKEPNSTTCSKVGRDGAENSF